MWRYTPGSPCSFRLEHHPRHTRLVLTASEGYLNSCDGMDGWYTVDWGRTGVYNNYRVDEYEAGRCDLAVHEKAFGSRFGRIDPGSLGHGDELCKVDWFGGQSTWHALPSGDGRDFDLKFADSKHFPVEMLCQPPAMQTNLNMQLFPLQEDPAAVGDGGPLLMPARPTRAWARGPRFHQYWLNFCLASFDNEKTPKTLTDIVGKRQCTGVVTVVWFIWLLLLIVMPVGLKQKIDECRSAEVDCSAPVYMIGLPCLACTAVVVVILGWWVCTQGARRGPSYTIVSRFGPCTTRPCGVTRRCWKVLVVTVVVFLLASGCLFVTHLHLFGF